MHNDEEGIVARPGAKRLRLLATAVAVPLFGVVAAFGTVQNGLEPVPARTVTERLALSAVPLEDAAAIVYFREEPFRRDDTPATLLQRLGAAEGEAAAFLRSSQAVRSFRLLRPGASVSAKIDGRGGLRSLWFLAGDGTIRSVDRLGDGFVTSDQDAEVTRRVEIKSGEIETSLFGATDDAGISDGIAIQLADIFGGDLDFHRDLREGDRFAVVFEAFYYGGRVVRSGRVLAAEFSNRKTTYRAIWFQDLWGKGGYYTPEGTNLRKTFLRSPLEFSRITSRFGVRRHPIFQHWRAHQGVDYGAPTGTRVKSTGEGVVAFAGRRSGYGNLVVLRHHDGYSTYYAHLRNFARGLKAGRRVAQGETIGYVGQSGWATGPHLHYEFRVHGRHRNPLTMAFPAARPLSPSELPRFRQVADPLAARLDLLRDSDLALLE
jgi:murein DD-endopeptidase MepM/ murein hydrolase activator NlpD